ncbi:hypothetical protein DRP05_15055 [Archaeoglobales archaeon]|nr:MAG: hypothetical protein DRP05_15055 [Archaeoglobales archaeon]
MKVFLDANVIANWILIKKGASGRHKKDSVLSERYKYLSQSYNLLERLQSLKLEVFTSQLAIGETLSVIYDDAINLKLYTKGFPTATWTRIGIREKERLEKEEAYEIYEGIMKIFDELFSFVKILDDVLDLELLGHLILLRGIRTHDAILLTTVISNEMDYFVTRDGRLTKKMRNSKRQFGLELLSSINLLNKIS